MNDVLWILLAAAACFVANALPAFAPANWMILAVFRLAGVPMIPLGVAGAAGAAGGRAVLALAARSATRWLPDRQRANADALVARIAELHQARLPFVALYSVSPLPSNVLFVAVGVGRFSILPAAAVFFACRAVSDTFWTWAFTSAGEEAIDALLRDWLSWQSVALQVASLLAVVALFRLPWARWLGTPEDKLPR